MFHFSDTSVTVRELLSALSFRRFANELLRSKGGEQLLHDIVLVELGFNILTGNIAELSQVDLCERPIGNNTTQKGCETNLVCQAIDGLWRGRLDCNSAK